MTRPAVSAAPGPVRGVVGVIGVRAMLAAFRGLGLDTRRVQDAAGILDRDLADPDRLLPARALYRMWEVADGLWNRPGLGLEAGPRVPPGSYEVLDYLLASAATLREAMKDFAACMALATRTAEYDVDEDGDLVRCRMRWRIPPRGVMFQLRDYSLAALARRVREAGGGAPLQVEIEGPPLTTADHYSRVLRAPVVLQAETNALVFTRERWVAPLPRADASLHRTLRRHAELLLERTSAAAAESLADRVRCELLRRIRVGLPAIGEVARALGLGSRTLQRQLRQEGASFAALADEVRRSMAVEYLRDPALTIAEVAYLLGFSEPSALTRAFRRWTGRTPEEARARS